MDPIEIITSGLVVVACVLLVAIGISIAVTLWKQP